MNSHVSSFLDTVCDQIKHKAILGGISEELECHINELTDTYIESGLSDMEASQKAVEQMGDPVKIGQELNKTHRPKTEWTIVALIGAMVLMGGITLFTYANDPGSPLSLDGLLASYLLYSLLGLGICSLFYFLDYTKLEKYSLHIFIIAIVFLFIRGRVPTHIGLVGLRFPSASLALPLLLISLSGLINRWANGNVKDMSKLVGLIALAVLALLLFANSVSISAGFLVAIAVSITLAIMSKNFKGNRKVYLFSLYGGGISGVFFIIAFVLKPYQWSRFLAFANPNDYSTGWGWIVILLRDTMSSAKFFGKSDSLYVNFQGVDRILLPEANTDFIFAYMVSAFGWIIGIVTILMITLAIERMFKATRKINHGYGTQLSISIVSIFTLQALGNILMNMGVFPTVSVSLPFMSYGGTNFVINMALIGLLLGIYRRKDLVMLSDKPLVSNKSV